MLLELVSPGEICDLPTFWRVGLNVGLLVSSALNDCPLLTLLLTDRPRLFQFADMVPSRRWWED